MMDEEIKQLQQELYSTLKKANQNRKIAGIARVLNYGAALVYFLVLFTMQASLFSRGETSFFYVDYTENPNPTFFEQNKLFIAIIPLIAIVTIGGYGLSIFQRKHIEAEQQSIKRIIYTLFPEAKLSLGFEPVSSSLISKSNLFGTNNDQNLSFGSVSFGHSQPVVFRDLLVGSSHTNWFMQTSIGGFFLVISMMLKGVFSKRAENIVGTFRGMFADAKIDKNINGTVIVLPDHLEKHLDYLAKSIQTLKNTNTNKLVKLEDIEFEHYFAVYSSDEITARYVLTPAMMRRMTELKKRYNRDIMFSFNKDHFFFAVAMPEGFLTLGSKPLTSEDALRDLYANFITVKETLQDLNLQ